MSEKRDQQKIGRSVRLTGDLLYMVNKKLKSMDKASRDETLNGFTRQPHPSNRPFTEVMYRKENIQDLSETEQAVMHKEVFNSTSIAVCEYDCMSQFVFKMPILANIVESPDYKHFLLFHKRDAGAKLKNPVARFVQLPSDYFIPDDLNFCVFFAELAWKENGVILVEADNFALCMIIYSLKEWLICPAVCSYLLSCGKADGLDCRCRNLIHAMCTDENLRKFFQDKTSFLRADIDEDGDDVENQRSMAREQLDELEEVGDEMKEYAEKLVNGEEAIQSGRYENVISSLQVANMAEKIEKMLECVENKIRQKNRRIF